MRPTNLKEYSNRIIRFQQITCLYLLEQDKIRWTQNFDLFNKMWFIRNDTFTKEEREKKMSEISKKYSKNRGDLI